MNEIIVALAIAAALWALTRPAFLLTADRLLTMAVGQDKVNYPVKSGVHIYRHAFIGLDPAGYAQPFVPGLHEFKGIAFQEVDATSDSADGDSTIELHTLKDVVETLTGATVADVGKPVYATDDETLALSGHPLALVGIIVRWEATDTVLVRMRRPGETPPSGQGSVTLKLSGHELVEPTGATAGDALVGAFEFESILGPGFVFNDEEDGGFELEFDATAEIALSSIRTPHDIFPVDKGLRMSLDVNITANGDAAAPDLDIGFGTALTTDSQASIDHAAMVQLVALHVDGNSLNLLVQSDDNSTDVAPTDSTIDYAEGTPFHVDICVSPAGLCKIWVDGVDAGALANKTLQVLSTALLAAFINLEKTSDDTVYRLVVKNLVVTAGMAA